MHLKQFAVYALGSSKTKKRTVKPSIQEKRHRHLQKHQRIDEFRKAKKSPDDTPLILNKRETCAMVTATIDGKVVSWMNNYMCTPASATPVLASNAKIANTGPPGPASTITVTVFEASRITLTTTITPTVTKTTGKSSDNGTSSMASESTVPTLQSFSSAPAVSQIASSGALLGGGNDGAISSRSASPELSSTSSSTVSSDSNSASTVSSSPSASSINPSSANSSSNGENGVSSSNSVGSTTSTSAVSSQSSATGGQIADGDYGRTAYYNSKDQTADALVFLNANTEHSGVFDTYSQPHLPSFHC